MFVKPCYLSFVHWVHKPQVLWNTSPWPHVPLTRLDIHIICKGNKRWHFWSTSLVFFIQSMINQQRGLNKQGREGAISPRSLIIAEFQLQMTVTILTNNQNYNLDQQSTASVGDMMVVHLQVSDGGIGQMAKGGIGWTCWCICLCLWVVVFWLAIAVSCLVGYFC